MALWHNLLLSACWAGGSAPAFPLAAFDYWPLMPHLLTCCFKDKHRAGCSRCHTAPPWSLHAAQTAPFLHFQAHRWHQPTAGDLPAGAAAAPVRVWWCQRVLVAQEPPSPAGTPELGPGGVPEQETPSFLMGSSAPPSPALLTSNPPVPLGEALLCPKDGQGKEGTGLGAPGTEEGIFGEPSSKPRCPGASPGSPSRVAMARGLSQPWDTSPQPPMPAHRGHPAAPRPAQGPPRQPRAPPRAGEKEQLTLLPPTRERRCHQTPAFFPFPLGACSS